MAVAVETPSSGFPFIAVLNLFLIIVLLGCVIYMFINYINMKKEVNDLQKKINSQATTVPTPSPVHAPAPTTPSPPPVPIPTAPSASNIISLSNIGVPSTISGSFELWQQISASNVLP